MAYESDSLRYLYLKGGTGRPKRRDDDAAARPQGDAELLPQTAEKEKQVRQLQDAQPLQ